MKITSLLLVVGLFTFFSCKKTLKVSTRPLSATSINGTWEFKTYLGAQVSGFVPIISPGTFLRFNNQGTYSLTDPSNQLTFIKKNFGSYNVALKNEFYVPKDALVGVLSFSTDSMHHLAYLHSDTLILDYGAIAVDGSEYVFQKAN